MSVRQNFVAVLLASLAIVVGVEDQGQAQNAIEHVDNTGSPVQVSWDRTFSVPQFNRSYARLDNVHWYLQPRLVARANVRNGGTREITVTISGFSQMSIDNISSFTRTVFVSANSGLGRAVRPGNTASLEASANALESQGLIEQSDLARFKGSGRVFFPARTPPGSPSVFGGGQVSSASLNVLGGIRITYYYTDLGMNQADPIVPETATPTPAFANFPSGRWVNAQLPGAGLVFTSTTPGGTFSSMTLPSEVYGRYAIYTNTTQFHSIANSGENVTFEPGTVSKIHLYGLDAANGLTNMPVQLSFSSATMNIQISRIAAASGRSLYYKDSAFHSNGGVVAALDGSKVLIPGAAPQSTTNANVSNYSRGINGVVVDVANLANNNLTLADFNFRVSPPGTTGVVNPSSWSAAPAPSLIGITPGSPTTPTRIRFEWADNAIQNQWLQLVVNPTARTGLAHPAVFYLGHALGEVNGTSPYRITGADLSAIQAAISNNLVEINETRDLNKDRRITVDDLSLVQTRISNAIVLNNITVPARGSSEEGASIPQPEPTP